MSHPDPLFDFDNSYEDDMVTNFTDYNYDYSDDFYGDDEDFEDNDYYDDEMDGDHDSAMGSVGWAEDEYYNPSMYDYGDW